MQRVENVEDYISSAAHWRDEIGRLRKILLSTPLDETVKWGGPCYTYKGKNVVGLGAFKSYFGLWFYQGALLDDDAGVLINAQQGKTRALRQWRMTAAGDIQPAIIKRYVNQAIALVESGKEMAPERGRPVVVPADLRNAMRRHKGATAAFRSLRKGLQREYADYVASAKREDTRQRRIDKILPMIAAGKGLNDKYR
ncbi:MAG: YdeI/OmpD-associated family protein [Woeseiaceae bacterium]|nr:YdeI/OmpD-associated family protein [Woeseiaceae bacterium]